MNTPMRPEIISDFGVGLATFFLILKMKAIVIAGPPISRKDVFAIAPRPRLIPRPTQLVIVFLPVFHFESRKYSIPLVAMKSGYSVPKVILW